MTSGDLGQVLSESVVHVSSADETVFAELSGERHVRVWFAPEYYETAGSTRLGRQLSSLARVLFTAAMMEHDRVVARYFGRSPEPSRPVFSPEEREFAERVARIVARGESPDGAITVVATAMKDFAVMVRPGTTELLAEEQFTASVKQAAEGFIEDQIQQASRARWETFIAHPIARERPR